MPLAIRVVTALGLVAFACFCGFGFLATYEPPGFPLLRIVYGVLGASSVIAAGWLTARPARFIR